MGFCCNQLTYFVSYTDASRPCIGLIVHGSCTDHSRLIHDLDISGQIDIPVPDLCDLAHIAAWEP